MSFLNFRDLVCKREQKLIQPPLFQVNMKTRLFRHYGPQKEKFSLGIQALQILKTGDVLVGAGDGTVALLKSQTYKRIRYNKVDSNLCLL